MESTETELRKEGEHTRVPDLQLQSSRSVGQTDMEPKRCQTDIQTAAKIVIAAFHASECRSISRSSAAGATPDDAAVLS